MEFDKELMKDVEAKIEIKGGKVFVTLEYDGVDAVIDGLKSTFPAWMAPLLDLAKVQIDAL